MKTLIPGSLLLGLLLLAGQALAQSQPATSLPDWDKLTPQQREALIAPVRERWNGEPEERSRMLERAQRWKSMTPEQRGRARKGLHRFEQMNPQQREEARALFARAVALAAPGGIVVASITNNEGTRCRQSC